jgi:ABC-2 type transport system ATP-binding protein
MIEISNLTKRYGNRIALDDISFVVEKGDIVGLLGPNGAGKSTAMNILTGYISYNEGSVKIDGMEVIDNPNKVKGKIGYLPEQPPLYLDMTVYDYLDFVFKLKKIKFDKRQHINEVMEKVNILDVQERLIKNLSKGYRQRIGLAGALIGEPEILILDEPTVGLDPVQNIEVRNLIKKLGKDKTVILNSHILPEVSAICDKIIIINNGVIVAQDTTENLTSGNLSLEEIFVKLINEDISIDEIYKEQQLSCDEMIDMLENESELKALDDNYKLTIGDEALEEDE